MGKAIETVIDCNPIVAMVKYDGNPLGGVEKAGRMAIGEIVHISHEIEHIAHEIEHAGDVDQNVDAVNDHQIEITNFDTGKTVTVTVKVGNLVDGSEKADVYLDANADACDYYENMIKLLQKNLLKKCLFDLKNKSSGNKGKRHKAETNANLSKESEND